MQMRVAKFLDDDNDGSDKNENENENQNCSLAAEHGCPVVVGDEDENRECKTCSKAFVFAVGEQQFYADKARRPTRNLIIARSVLTSSRLLPKANRVETLRKLTAVSGRDAGFHMPMPPDSIQKSLGISAFRRGGYSRV